MSWDHFDLSSWKLARWTWLGVALMPMACGLPPPPDIRKEMSDAIKPLGIRPFYPIREQPKIGTVFLVDANNVPGSPTFDVANETSLTVTEDLIPLFEAEREKLPSVRMRYAQSPADLATKLQPPSGAAHFIQGPAAASAPNPPAPAAAAAPAGKPAKAKPAAAKPAPAAEPTVPELSLAAFPGYTLASIDQASVAGFLPGAVASFLGGLGLRRTSVLQMEAQGVEEAELPFDKTLQVMTRACRGEGNTVFAGQGTGAGTINTSALIDIMIGHFEQLAKTRGTPVNPEIEIVRHIFYMRGINFILNDSRAMSLAAQVALSNAVRSGATPAALPQITVTNNQAPAAPPAAAASDPAKTAQLQASLDSLNQQVDSLRKSIASGTGTNVAASFVRATARGIEIVNVFDRPLAFGWQALTYRVAKKDGLRSACQNFDPFVQPATASIR